MGSFYSFGVQSSIGGLPSLDEMLSGGISGNWFLVGATGLGKTTLASSFLAQSPSAVLDFGIRQGYDRYVFPYDKFVSDFPEIVKGDKSVLLRNIKHRILDSKENSKEARCNFDRKWFGILDRFQELYYNHIKSSSFSSPKDRDTEIEASEDTASLGIDSKIDVVKLDLRNKLELEDLEWYFGRDDRLSDEPITYKDKLLAAFFYHNFRIRQSRRFFIDGISFDRTIDGKFSSFPGIVDPNVINNLWKYFDGIARLLVPYIGNNPNEFDSKFSSDKVTWAFNEGVASLTSVTLTNSQEGEIVDDISDAVNAARSLSLASDSDGIIVIGRNTRNRYVFADQSVAPSNTRILSIAKSRYSINETYREIILSEGKPALGREMVHR